MDEAGTSRRRASWVSKPCRSGCLHFHAGINPPAVSLDHESMAALSPAASLKLQLFGGTCPLDSRPRCPVQHLCFRREPGLLMLGFGRFLSLHPGTAMQKLWASFCSEGLWAHPSEALAGSGGGQVLRAVADARFTGPRLSGSHSAFTDLYPMSSIRR